ncbi:hypothetical protein D3C85_1352280 [compost metagenome]
MFAIIMGLLLPIQSAAPETASQTERAPRHWEAVSWSKRPMPVPPWNAKGTLQAEVFCVAGEDNRVTSCRIERQIPDGGGFGTNVLRSLRNARTRGDQVRPGDTMTINLWVCMDIEPGEPCSRIPWPTQ